MKLSQLSVNNSTLIHVISVFLILMGILSMMRLNREAFPNFSFDTVSIQTIYPGSTPQEVEKLITIPIEEELEGLDDIDEIKSYSAEGISMITVIIDEDAQNKDRVINEIQRAVDRVQDLPSDLEDKPLVQEITTKNKPVITMSLSGEVSESKLQDYALAMEKDVLDIPNVSKVVRSGWRDKEIWVEVNPSESSKEYVSLLEIIEALQFQNVSIPGGNFYKNKSEYLIRTSGEFETADEVKKVIVRSNTSGNNLRVEDVAKVSDGFEEEKIISKTNGKKTINLTVIKKHKGDTIDIVTNLHELSDVFKKQVKNKIDISFFNDMSFYIKRRLNVLVTNGILGMILVVISLFVFLSFRVAVAACMGLPITILSTFTLMYFFDVSINLLSMFGMIMVIGMLVDEEIVVSENIYRYLEKGENVDTATIKGADEVSRAVIATVLTTIAAFIPMFLMSGIMGKFVRNIPTVVNMTLIASLTVALFILPSHISHLMKGLKRSDLPEVKEKGFFTRMQSFYLKLLEKTLHRRYLTFTLVTLTLIFSIGVASKYMHFVLFPNAGVERFFIRAKGELGDSLEYSEKKIKPIEDIVATLPPEELDNFVTDIGILSQGDDDTETERGSHVSQITVFLHPESSRNRSADQIIEYLRPLVEKNSQFSEITFEKARAGPPLGKAIDVKVRGDDLKTLKEITKKISAFAKTIQGVSDVQDDTEQVIDIMMIDVDPVEASRAKLSVQKIASIIRTAFQGSVATTIKNSEEDIDVVVKLPIEKRYDMNSLNELLIPNDQQALIPLNKVAKVKIGKTLRIIKHDDGTRIMSVTGNVDEANTSSLIVSAKIQEQFKNISLDYPGYSIKFSGEQEKTQESLASLVQAFLLSIGLIFIILVAMFRSLSYSIIILMTIPYSIIGVVFAFFVHSLPLSFMAILGLVGLTGVVANSGIIMIDFIQKAVHASEDNLHTAIMEGAKLRFRPVILTTLTTALGVIPAAYGIGGLDPYIQPMALTLNYGLVFGAVLSLFFVPAMVAIFHDIKFQLHKITKTIFGH